MVDVTTEADALTFWHHATMGYHLTLEATIDARSDQEALRLMADKLLELVTDKRMQWPSHGYFGGFGYPMTYQIEVLPEDQDPT